MHFVQRIERFKDAFVGVGVVELVLAVVVEEVLVGFAQKFFAGLDPIVGGEGAANEGERTIADVCGDEFIGEMRAVEVFECGVDLVAKVLRGVDQGAVEVEDEKFETVHGHRTEDADHEIKCNGTAMR